MLEDNKQFEKYVKLCGGNRYVATTFVSKLARNLAEKYNNVISHAEALSWIISGRKPKVISNYNEILKLREQKSLSIANNVLKHILDVEVKEAVFESIKRSKQADHLIYFYKEVYDEYRQSRIRILVRKIWYMMKEQETSF